MKLIDADELLKRLPDDLPYKASVKRVLLQAPTSTIIRDIFNEFYDEGFEKHGKIDYELFERLEKKYVGGN